MPDFVLRFFVSVLLTLTVFRLAATPFAGPLDGFAVCAEQKSGSIALVDASRPGAPDFAWTWNCKEDPGVDRSHVRWFGAPSDCKMIAGRTVLMIDSHGAFARIPLAKGRVECYGYIGGNPHSIAQLPGGGFLVTASSVSNRLTLVEVAKHPMEPDRQWKRFYPLDDAHGVEWDARRGCLWAIGESNIVRYAWRPERRELVEKARFDFRAAAGCGGHDLQPDGRGGYLFTTPRRMMRFDPETGRFEPVLDRKNVKSVSRDKDRGDLLTVVREVWWTDRLIVRKDGTEYEVGPYAGARFYKARWAK